MAHPTAALLWAACHPTPSPDAVRDAVAAGADLDEAASLAIAQRVSPLLSRALAIAGISEPDAEWEANLRRDTARCHAQSRLLLPRIGELALAPLAAAGLETLVIKGAALAHRYPDPGLRPMDDVDLILPSHEVDAGAAAPLSAAGWTRHETPRRLRHELQFTHRGLPGLAVDLHRSLATWRKRSNRLTTDGLWAARQPTTLYDATSFVLPPALEFVMLAAHAGKPWHAFDRLIWVVDLAVVANEGLDWDEVGRLAAAARCQTPVAVGLTLALNVGLESPAELRRIASAWRMKALKPLLSPDWPATVHSGEQRVMARYALIDERTRRAAVTLGEFTSNAFAAAPRRTYWVAKRNVRRNAKRRERLS